MFTSDSDLEELRRRRHRAAFLGHCGMESCLTCTPPRAGEQEWRRRGRARREIAGHQVAVKALGV